MKAVIIQGFGSPDVLRLADLPIPKPAKGEVLIKNYAAGINPIDCKTREGHGVPVKKFPAVLGWDVSGIVEATGPGVARFKKGDEVFGMIHFPHLGHAYAEYMVAPEEQLAFKPKNIDHTICGCVPMVALTAWQGLFELAHLQPGQKVFIHGAAGGVGHLAVQLGHLTGAEVTATASSHNKDFLSKLGANRIVDYRKEKMEDAIEGMDVVIDTRGGEDYPKLLQVVKPGGMLVSLLGREKEEHREAAAKKRKVRTAFTFVKPNREVLENIATLISEKKLHMQIQQVFKLEEAALAHTESEKGHSRGKLLFSIQ